VKAGVLLAVGVAVTLVGCTGSGKSPTPSQAPTHGATTSAVAVAKSLSLGDGESFDPPVADTHPRLTATQAWVAYAKRVHARINRSHIPPGTTAMLGMFTDGGGRSHIAYGYFTPNSAPVYAGPVVPSPPVLCTQWTMLSARTGVHIESAWFRCPPTHFSPVARPRSKR